MDSCSEDSMDGFMQLRSSIKAAKLYLTRGKDNKQNEVRVGIEYQAVIPPYKDVSYTTQQDNSVLLWIPNQSDEDMLRDYLYKACLVLGDCGRDVLPLGKQCRDDELALYYLYKTGHKIVKTLKEIRNLYQKEGLELHSNFRQVESWSLEDCEKFETGLRKHWKNFYEIQKEMLPHRKLMEIVEFYYFWKKSERFENFLQHNRKKKVTGTGSQGTEQGEEFDTGVDKTS
ncbi:Mesoderm induction early response protein 1 [Oopsacas minuta]|uniref:Mesoderm induction early response protein 1 n=1 Tax=Oopsacas minuta TaxID=111878 RepID=A0AAV7JDX6_9METZ|nr:Mesoderm induction early response protein 1 [Oopsacas minuta]